LGAPDPTKQLAQALHRRIQAQIRPHAHDVADLLVQHIGGQAERRNIGSHQSARDRVLFEYRDLVAHRQQVVCDGKRRRARADAGNALAVLLTRRLGQERGDVVTIVGRNALQPANGNRLGLDSAAAAGRFAGSIAHPAQNAREDVGLSIHHVCGGELALGDQTDVFGNIGVCRTRPLAIHNSMKIIRLRRIGRLHDSSYGCPQPVSKYSGPCPETSCPGGIIGLNLHYVDIDHMNLLQGQDATCPHCWETVNLTLDLSVPEQSYVEDCPVCCKPMLVSYAAADGEVVQFSVESAE
jgi:hypothetical protein